MYFVRLQYEERQILAQQTVQHLVEPPQKSQCFNVCFIGVSYEQICNIFASQLLRAYFSRLRGHKTICCNGVEFQLHFM